MAAMSGGDRGHGGEESGCQRGGGVGVVELCVGPILIVGIEDHPRVISEPSADTSWMARSISRTRGDARTEGEPERADLHAYAIGSLRTTRSGVAAIDEALEIATIRVHLIAETSPPIIDVHVGLTDAP